MRADCSWPPFSTRATSRSPRIPTSSSIWSRSDDRVLLGDIRAGAIARLPAGVYHVVSRYGGLNAVRSADVTVDAGKLTRVSLRHAAGKSASSSSATTAAKRSPTPPGPSTPTMASRSTSGSAPMPASRSPPAGMRWLPSTVTSSSDAPSRSAPATSPTWSSAPPASRAPTSKSHPLAARTARQGIALDRHKRPSPSPATRHPASRLASVPINPPVHRAGVRGPAHDGVLIGAPRSGSVAAVSCPALPAGPSAGMADQPRRVR